MVNTIFKKSKHLILAFAILFCAFISIPASAAQHYYIRPLRNGDTVYYDNSNTGWSTVRIYLFNNSDQSHPFEWGTQPSMDHIENNIWRFEVTDQYSIEGHGYDYIIFSNGDYNEQTIDLGFIGSGYAYQVNSWDGYRYSGIWYLYDASAVTPEYVTAIGAGDTIYFNNSGTNWNGVNIYLYNPNNPGDGSGPYLWNGTAMSPIGNNIYEFIVPDDINIEDYNDTHLIFSNTDGNSQTIDLGFLTSGYAYKVESFDSNDHGFGYWYVYDKSTLQALVDEASDYLSKLSCLASSEYASLTQAITDANYAINNEIPVEGGDALVLPNAYWNQYNTEITNLQNKLTSLQATYGVNPTVCALSLEIIKTITNPQTVYRVGDTVEFRIDITNHESFPLSVTVSEYLDGAVFTASTTGDYNVISDRVAETRLIDASETLSLYATYRVTTDVTNRFTNTVEITDSSATASGYYLTGDTAGTTFNTQSWNDVPVLTGIDSKDSAFYIFFIGGLVIIASKIAIQYRKRNTIREK